MEPQTENPVPRVLDTYGLVYAFTALYFIPALFAIDRWAIEPFSLPYLILLAGPFFLGPATVFALDSDDPPRTLAIRAAILAPLTAFTGLTVVFLTMMLIIPPLSLFVVPENFSVLAILMAATVVILALPVVVSLISRVREGFSAKNLIQIAVLLAALGVVAWIVVMTFDASDTLGTFLGEDIVDHFMGAFTWYLPGLGLAAGVWRRTGIV
ncbi:MAG: hypothetical protein RBS78_01285 [Coriobacteriia bacterium]|nr:hypothetical protein [Coriobacteriia bacterium]